MMKKIFWGLVCLFGMTQILLAQNFPEKPNTLVNDYTHTLTQSQKESLEQKLVALDDSTSRQFTICILQTVGEYDIDEYTLGLGRKWGIGTKGHDNGVLILVALGDRKISIQVGYGLEGAIPDMYARRVIDQIIKPNFKEQRYYKGLDEAIDALIAMSKGEYAKVRERKSYIGGVGAIIFIVIIIVVVILIANKGGNNGGGRGLISGRGSGLVQALIWGALSSRGGGSSSWGGGSSSSGGGFGGFGGGSFGGGGSSGSW